MTKNGMRLKSQVCQAQVIIVKSSAALADLRCGGQLMVPLDQEHAIVGAPDPSLAQGAAMGKRYVDETGGEVLVTKAGEGTLSVGSTPLALKEAKPLPASD